MKDTYLYFHPHFRLVKKFLHRRKWKCPSTKYVPPATSICCSKLGHFFNMFSIRSALRSLPTAIQSFHFSLAQFGIMYCDSPSQILFLVYIDGYPSLWRLDQAENQWHQRPILRLSSELLIGVLLPPQYCTIKYAQAVALTLAFTSLQILDVLPCTTLSWPCFGHNTQFGHFRHDIFPGNPLQLSKLYIIVIVVSDYGLFAHQIQSYDCDHYFILECYSTGGLNFCDSMRRQRTVEQSITKGTSS